MPPKFDFMGFIPTPGEKHVGIAEVRVNGGVTIVLRYKIVAKKDGTGFFPTCASYKMPNRHAGEEYDECFMIDSRSENDAINKCIMHGFYLWHRSTQPSVFVPQHNPTPFIERPEYQNIYEGTKGTESSISGGLFDQSNANEPPF